MTDNKQVSIFDSADLLRAQQLALYMRSVRSASLVSVLVAFVSVVAMAQPGNLGIWLPWLLLVALVNGARLAQRRDYYPDTIDAGYIHRHMRRATVLSQVNSALWGGGFVAFWVHATGGAYLVLCIIAAGMVTSNFIQHRTMPRSATAIIVCGVAAGVGAALVQTPVYAITALILLAVFGFLMIEGVWSQARFFERRMKEERELARQSETVSLLLRQYEASSSDWLWEVDEGNCLRNVCERFAAAAQCPVQDLEAAELVGLFKPSPEREQLAANLLGRKPFRDLVLEREEQYDGATHWWALSGNPQSDGSIRGVISDVTGNRRAEARIARLARYDTLTSLANRYLFNETLCDAVEERMKNQRMALLSIDLDHFKAVNDTYGHQMGDALLREVAQRISFCVRSHDLAARLGGDEFAVLMPRVRDVDQVHDQAQAILDRLDEPFCLSDHVIRVSGSIGIAHVDCGNHHPEEVLRQSDLALYAAKHAGRGCFADFDPEMDMIARDRRALERDLRDAVAAGQLELHFQAQVDMKTGARNGMEALLRWNHPTRGQVPPGDFIGLAEETGLILPIGEWVIREALQKAARWAQPLNVAVNLSPIQLRNPNLVAVVASAIASSGIAPNRVEIEITESALLHDSEANMRLLHRLRALGVRIALDDFGTGYSSLNYLRNFPFDTIKIDRCFVEDVIERSDCQAIIRATIGLALELGMSTVAEGIEEEAQYAWLAAQGCTSAQGFLIARPMPLEDTEVAGRFPYPVGQPVAVVEPLRRAS